MKKGFTIVELLLVFAIPTIILLVCIWTDRNLDYLLTWIAGQPRNCPWWLSTIAAFVGNGLTILFNIVMEIIRIAR